MATASSNITRESRRNSTDSPEQGTPQNACVSTAEYCAKLQEWMWNYYCGYANWQSWMAFCSFPFPPSPPCTFPFPGGPATAAASSHAAGQPAFDARSWYPNHPNHPYPGFNHPYPGFNHPYPGFNHPYPFSFPAPPDRGTPAPPHDARPVQQQNGNPPQPGREYTIPTPLHRFLAETVDFFILFCVKATIVLWMMHLSGVKGIAKFITHFIVEEIDENTSMEDLQKMMAVALVYRILVCFYEIICIWGAGGATPGKFLLGLRVVTCDTSVLVRPNRVLVVPASNVTLSASTVRAVNKNFSIAFLFPVFITLLFFQHNRTVYDIVAGTIVVQRRGAG